MKSPYIDSTPYCQLVEKFIFLIVTHPDIAYAISRISNYMAKPQQAHLEAAKHVLRYLQETLNYRIPYRVGAPLMISGYT